MGWFPTHVSGTGGHASAGSTCVIPRLVPGGGDFERDLATLDGLQLVLPPARVRTLPLSSPERDRVSGTRGRSSAGSTRRKSSCVRVSALEAVVPLPVLHVVLGL